MQLSIILINYNTFDMTCACIESIYEHTKNVDFEIILVDNASKECNADAFLVRFQNIRLIKNIENVGFGRANHKAIEIAYGAYLLLINSDVLLTENTIEKCISQMQQHPQIGALGCKILNQDLSLQKSIYHYIGEASEWILYNHWLCRFVSVEKKAIRALMGSFLMMPKNVYVESGGFDPHFFMYCEELDLCDRIQQKGYSLSYYKDTQIIHLHGASNQNNQWHSAQILQSRMLLAWKKGGVVGYLLNISFILFNLISNFLYLWNLNKVQKKEYWWNTKIFFLNFKKILIIPFEYSRSMGKYNKMLKV